MDEFMGVIKLFAGNFAPQGWLFCDGSLLPINQYQALYSLIGTQFGGNGTVNFALPDLRGRVAVGAGAGPGLTPRVQGTKAGVETATATGTAQVALTTANLPTHTHAIAGDVKVGVADEAGVVAGAPNNVLAKRAVDVSTGGTSPVEIYVGAADAHFTQGNKLGAVSHNLTAAPTGTGTPVAAPVSVNAPVMQPFVAINYIICTQGIYPMRP
jgi:microcystin-dependent protein